MASVKNVTHEAQYKRLRAGKENSENACDLQVQFDTVAMHTWQSRLVRASKGDISLRAMFLNLGC